MLLLVDVFGFDPKLLPPFGPDNAHKDMSSLVEDGFKEVVGYLTEGRWLVFEQGGYVTTNTGSGASDITLTTATANHEIRTHRWVIHAQGGAPTDGGQINYGTYFLASAVDGRYLASHTSLSKSVNGAETYKISFLGNGRGYSLQKRMGNSSVSRMVKFSSRARRLGGTFSP